jgi:RNA polymerase sigma factor (sigma-70 family)
MQDWQLLREFVEEGSQAAFGQLVERHLDFVYSTCRRELGDADLAHDAAQAVFLLLFQKAASLRPGTVLSGWLFQTARLVSKNARKQEMRWQKRHLKAAEVMMQEASVRDTDEENWTHIEPLLHDALSSLNTTERNAVLLRCFEGRSLKETGVALGLSEEAARKRVTRALEKLRGYFTRRGVTLSVATLGALLSQNAVQAAPASLSVAAIAAAAQGTTATATSALTLVETVQHVWLLSKIKIAVTAACGVSLVGIGVQRLTRPPKPALAQTVKITAVPTAKTPSMKKAVAPTVRLAPVATMPKPASKPVSKRVLKRAKAQLPKPSAPPKRIAAAHPVPLKALPKAPLKPAASPTVSVALPPPVSARDVEAPRENIKTPERNEEMQLKKTMVSALVGAALTASVAPAAEGDKGTVIGILTAKGENWIEVRADGDKDAKRYRPRWLGGAPQDGGGLDKPVLDSFKKLFVPNRVKLDWVIAEGPRVTAVEAIVPAEKSGTVEGEVTAKGENWVEVKGGDGAVNRYSPRWIGGLPKDGGGPDKDAIRAIGEVKPGDKVRLEWVYDERLRVVSIKK